jgi:hypothetical protein
VVVHPSLGTWSTVLGINRLAVEVLLVFDKSRKSGASI